MAEGGGGEEGREGRRDGGGERGRASVRNYMEKIPVRRRAFSLVVELESRCVACPDLEIGQSANQPIT